MPSRPIKSVLVSILLSKNWTECPKKKFLFKISYWLNKKEQQLLLFKNFKKYKKYTFLFTQKHQIFLRHPVKKKS